MRCPLTFRSIITESSGDVIETAQALVGLSVTANVSIAVVAIYMEGHEVFVFWVRPLSMYRCALPHTSCLLPPPDGHRCFVLQPFRDDDLADLLWIQVHQPAVPLRFQAVGRPGEPAALAPQAPGP